MAYASLRFRTTRFGVAPFFFDTRCSPGSRQAAPGHIPDAWRLESKANSGPKLEPGYAPPLAAGTIETSVSAASSVDNPERNRISSPPT